MSRTAFASQYSDASAPIVSIINDSFDPVAVRGLKQAEVVHNLAFARRRPDLRLYLLQCRSSCQKQQLIHGNRKLYGARCRSIIRCTTHQDRSEEHTSELQSLMRISYAVFCLKKKTNRAPTHSL